MAEGILNLVLGKLSDVVVKEVLLIHGVGEQVETLSRELSRIQAFLKDADMKQIVNERQKHWVKEVRDVAYDIEDVIDNAFFLKVSETPSKELSRGGFQIVRATKRMWSKHKKLPALHNLANEMNQILARIREINESRERYEINSLGEGSGELLRLPVRPLVVPDMDDPDVVGFNTDRDNIVKQLLDTSTKRRTVISIVGTGGLGKTTLAQKVYNSNDVKRWFDVHIWVAISQEFNLKDILRNIIEHVEPLSRNDLEGGEQYLLTKLYRTLNGKKYLLVLDDIWTTDLWTRIGGVLPNAEIGSRVIITSRFQNIANDVEPYKLPYLTEESSLQLLMKKALPNQDLSKGYLNDLYEVGQQFIKKCGGLPLALVVLGGLLSKRPAIYASWIKLLQTMNWGTDGRECTEIIATSYNDLPFVLKSCFMFFAAFPEDHEIDAQGLFRLWVAEGLILAEESRTLEDTAESFLEDLVQRSLVQVSQRSHTSSIKSCHIHDLLREVAIQKAKEENFLTICSNPDNWESCTKARHVAVHYSGCDELMEHANPKLQSLWCPKWPMPNCSQHRRLKVLSDMGQSQGVEFEWFQGLTQLRYCELSGYWHRNNFKSFESFIGNLKFVETLDFHLLENHPSLPDYIWNVKTLRHVKLWQHNSGPSSSANLRNLQTLMGVRSQESWNALLPKLPNVRDLEILVERSFSWDLFAKFLGTLKHLTCLKLLGNEVPEKIVSMQRFPFYEHLQSLTVWEQSPLLNNKFLPEVGMFPIHLTELTLIGLQFVEDPLSVLEKLQSLRMLSLEGEKANQKMSCSAGGFQQLHELYFTGMFNLEEWEIMADGMPKLKILRLEYCFKLGVPLGLQYLSNLKEVSVFDCSEIRKHEDEIRDICKHVPYVYIKI
ncbi:disease resistance protein RPP13-like [Carex rostrata]